MKARYAFLLLALLAFGGCAEQGMVESASGAMGERSDLRRASTVDTSQAWSAFIEKYPESSSMDRAVAARDNALWKETTQSDSASAYLDFARSKPEHPKAGEAKQRCHALLAKGRGSEADYLAYFALAPGDPGLPELRKALESVRFGNVQKFAGPGDAALFVAQYPSSAEAQKLLPDLATEAFADADRIGSRLAYQFFLKRYPSAAQAGDARSRLEPIPAQPLHEEIRKEMGMLEQIRRLPGLARMECRGALAFQLRSEADLYGEEAEKLRGELAELHRPGDETPDFCLNMSLRVPAEDRQAVANAVGGVIQLSQRKQVLGSLFADPEKAAGDAEDVAQRAGGMADDVEGEELELETLYGANPVNPDKPQDKASENMRDAAKRATRAAELSRAMPGKSDADAVMAAIDRQANLLLQVIAYYEKPAAAQ